jgi:RNase P subunit RPR2
MATNKVTSNVLKAFAFSRLQELLALSEALRRNGKSLDDVRRYIELRRSAMEKKEKIISVVMARRCPECGEMMKIAPVNTGHRDQTGDDSTFVWICSVCWHEEWTNKPLRKIIHDLHGGQAPKMVSVNTADPPQVVNEGCKPKPPAHCRRVRRPGRRRRKR